MESLKSLSSSGIGTTLECEGMREAKKKILGLTTRDKARDNSKIRHRVHRVKMAANYSITMCDMQKNFHELVHHHTRYDKKK